MALMIAGDVFAPEVSEVVNWVVTRLEAVKMNFERGAKVDQLQPGDSRRIMALITVKVQHLLKNLLTYRPPVNATRTYFNWFRFRLELKEPLLLSFAQYR